MFYCDEGGCRQSFTTKGGVTKHKYYSHLHPELRAGMRRDRGTMSLAKRDRDNDMRNAYGFADRSFK